VQHKSFLFFLLYALDEHEKSLINKTLRKKKELVSLFEWRCISRDALLRPEMFVPDFYFSRSWFHLTYF
jgi:hypothetical protein